MADLVFPTRLRMLTRNGRTSLVINVHSATGEGFYVTLLHQDGRTEVVSLTVEEIYGPHMVDVEIVVRNVK